MSHLRQNLSVRLVLVQVLLIDKEDTNDDVGGDRHDDEIIHKTEATIQHADFSHRIVREYSVHIWNFLPPSVELCRDPLGEGHICWPRLQFLSLTALSDCRRCGRCTRMGAHRAAGRVEADLTSYPDEVRVGMRMWVGV